MRFEGPAIARRLLLTSADHATRRLTAQPRSLRLFLAIWPGAEVRARIAEHAGSWSLPPGCLRYEPEDWHVTLHYIGEVAMERIAALADAVDLPREPVDLLLDKPQMWPRGLAVLGASRVPPTLQDLHRLLGGVLAGLDLPVETRTYRPHVTLARRAAAARLPDRSPAVAWRVRSFGLVVSTGRRERRYEVIREYGCQSRPVSGG